MVLAKKGFRRRTPFARLVGISSRRLLPMDIISGIYDPMCNERCYAMALGRDRNLQVGRKGRCSGSLIRRSPPAESGPLWTVCPLLAVCLTRQTGGLVNSDCPLAGCPWREDQGNCSTPDYPSAGTGGVYALSLQVTLSLTLSHSHALHPRLRSLVPGHTLSLTLTLSLPDGSPSRCLARTHVCLSHTLSHTRTLSHSHTIALSHSPPSTTLSRSRRAAHHT